VKALSGSQSHANGKLSNTNTVVWGSEALMQTLMQKAHCAGCNLQLAVVGIGSAAPLWLTVTKSDRKLPTSMLLQQTQTNRMQGTHMNDEKTPGGASKSLVRQCCACGGASENELGRCSRCP
jgi:hypothetical protein